MEISCDDALVKYGARTVLGPLTLEFEPGVHVLVTGEAGTGKTTLLKVLAALHPLTSGEIRWDKVPSSQLARRGLRTIQARMGMVFQSDALFDSLTVLENVTFPLERRGVATEEAKKRARKLLSQVGLLESAELLPASLSGGMRKRAGIARALAVDPELLLADDPFAGLDPATSLQIARLLSRFTSGRTLVVAAADPPEGLTFDAHVKLELGQLEEHAA